MNPAHRAAYPKGERRAAEGNWCGDSSGTLDSTQDRLTAIVLAYVASVATSIAIMVTLLKAGW
jgi:hypothetical protein